MSEESLKDKTVKGTAWSSIDNIAQYAVSFVVGVVLARLLTPDNNGLASVNFGYLCSQCCLIIHRKKGSAINVINELLSLRKVAKSLKRFINGKQ